nr:hypothetical protein [Tanacetum cinerariifolium]
QMMKGFDTGIQEKKAKLFNEWERNQVVQNTVQNPRVQNIGNQNGLIGVPGNASMNRKDNLVAAHAEGNAAGQNGNQIRCFNCRGEKAGIQLQAEEFDLMVAATDLDEIEKVNENCILIANLQQASTSGTQSDKALIYDSDRSAEVHDYESCDDNEIFNMLTQEEHYIELLEPIPEQHQVPQNDNNVISEVTSVEQGGETVEQHPTSFEETRALYDSLYQNLAIEVEKVNSHDPPVVHDSEKTLQLAQESCEKMKQLNKELKPANYTKINHLSEVFVSQTAKSREEIYFSNDSKTANVSKSISIPNEEFSDDTTPSVARKFLNEVKSTIVTLQRVVKHRMTLETHNWSSSAHQELHKIVKDESFLIVNQVDARVQNFEIRILKEAAKFVGDFKSLAKEADESLAKHKALELEIERLLESSWQNAGNLNGYNAVQNVGNQNQIGNGNLVAVRAEGNAAGHNGNQLRCYNCRGVGHFARDCTVRPRRMDAAYLQTELLIAQKEEAGIQLQAEEYDLMAAAADLSSGTQTDSAPVYDSDGSAEVHENYDNNEIFNMFTQEEQYTKLLEPIPEPLPVPHNDNNVISEVTNMEQDGETVEQHPANFEETHALYESLYQNLAVEVEKVNSVNRKLKETNADLTTKLARPDIVHATCLCARYQAQPTEKHIKEGIVPTEMELELEQSQHGSSHEVSTSTASTTIADNVPIPTNSSSHATNIPITSQDVDELNSNAMVDGNMFVNPFANPSTSAAAETSSSHNVDPSNMHTFYQPYPHEFQ